MFVSSRLNSCACWRHFGVIAEVKLTERQVGAYGPATTQEFDVLGEEQKAQSRFEKCFFSWLRYTSAASTSGKPPFGTRRPHISFVGDQQIRRSGIHLGGPEPANSSWTRPQSSKRIKRLGPFQDTLKVEITSAKENKAWWTFERSSSSDA